MAKQKKQALGPIDSEMDLNEKIRHLYMLYFNPQEIATLCDITLHETVQIIAELNLKHERHVKGTEYLSKCVESHLSGLDDIVKLSIENLRRFLLDHAQSEHHMTVKDAKMMSDLVSNIHRMAQLERQLPTSISKVTGATEEDVRVALKEALEDLRAVDPFVNYDKHATEDDSSKLN